MNSQQYKHLSSLEDNNIKSFSLLCKALRESRSERFIDDYLPILSKVYSIKEDNHKYTISTENYGVLDYFPKVNKLLIRKKNKWIKPGLKWIINNLLKE